MVRKGKGAGVSGGLSPWRRSGAAPRAPFRARFSARHTALPTCSSSPLPCFSSTISASSGLPLVSQGPRGLPYFRCSGRYGPSFKPRHFMRPETHHQFAIEELLNRHLASAQRVPPARLFDLQNPVIQCDGVVRIHRALLLNREHPVQILPPGADKR